MKTLLRPAVCFVLLLASAICGRTGEVTFNGTTYQTCVAPPEWVEVFWLNSDGKPFQELAKLQTFLAASPLKIHMMMNAGIFEEGGVPCGLTISNSSELRPLNTADGKGNFYLKPTGVFFVDPSGAHVVTSDEYAKMKPTPRAATQSGPLLLRAGKMHPKFDPASASRLHRNGVGILPDGRVLFAITKLVQGKRPNFYEFAKFFESQGCKDAMFLDGNISRMELEPSSELATGDKFGAMIAVIEPVEEK